MCRRAHLDDVASGQLRWTQSAHRVGRPRAEHGVDLDAAGHPDVRPQAESHWSDDDFLPGPRDERAAVLDVLTVDVDRSDAPGDGEPVVDLGA
jgi:hypothetical protein